MGKIFDVLAEYHWFSEAHQIVHVTEMHDEKEILTALVNLTNDTVENMQVRNDLLPQHLLSRFDVHSTKARVLMGAKRWAGRQSPAYPDDLRWYEDRMKFETIRESHEWAYSVVYNEIGTRYDGYKTTDEKIAYSLVYELTRLNTFDEPKVKVFAHEDYDASNSVTVYRVWVVPSSER